MTSYVYAAAGAALLLGGFFTGVKVTNNANDVKQLIIERQYQEQLAAEHKRANDLALKIRVIDPMKGRYKLLGGGLSQTLGDQR